jgi:predicted SAM-dependent methyltransferase
MNLKKPGLILNVGCGPNMHPENINLDYHWQPGIDVCCDITGGLPFPDSYVAGIFTEHCLEHIPFRSALLVLREFRRIIRPGGYVRIVPDLAIYVDRYASALPMPCAADDPVDDIYSPAMSINRIMRSHGHCFIYDFETLTQMIAAAGFVDIVKTKCGVACDARLLLDTQAREVESLYMEARVRPLAGL